MSSWTSWLVGRRDNPNAAREAIVGLRQQLLMLDKKEEHLNKKIDDETKKARAAVTTNKRGEWEQQRRSAFHFCLTNCLRLAPW